MAPMVTATLFLSGIDMSEDEYRETFAHAKRFEFTNGVVTTKRGPYMTPKSHVAIAEEVSAAFREYRQTKGGFGGQAPTTNLSQGPDRVYRLPDFAYWAPGRRVGDSIFDPPSAGIEIVSPDQNLSDLRAKCRFYRSRGIDVCWLIHPDQRWVEVWDAQRDGARVPDGGAVESAALPDFRLDLARLWAAIDAAPA
jgi:Uma2 family endonuclease